MKLFVLNKDHIWFQTGIEVIIWMDKKTITAIIDPITPITGIAY